MLARNLDREPLNLSHGIPTKWLWVVWNPEGFKCGKNVDIGAFTTIFARCGVIIEDDVQIGSHCAIYSVNTINDTHGTVIIGRGAMIGSHCVILPSVAIEPGKLIKAGRVISK